MRTRRLNKTKDPANLATDANENNGPGNPPSRSHSRRSKQVGARDGDVIGKDAAGDEARRDKDQSGKEGRAGETAFAENEVAVDESPVRTRRPTAARGSVSSGSSPPETPPDSGDPHELLQYPIRSRNFTRVYTGPLRGRMLFGVLRDLMYGPDYEGISLIWSLLDRWAFFPVLPPALPPRHPEGLIPSPWLSAGFEASIHAANSKWYRNRQAFSPLPQKSHSLSANDTRTFVPNTEGNVITLLGPWDGQKEYRLKPGSPLSLSLSNIAVDDPNVTDKTPSGWIFDVGGLVLALDWAPSRDQEKQILCLAVVPHSDQETRQTDDELQAEEGTNSGSIQFWEFTADSQDQERLPRPSNTTPSFLGALCFDWGRPKRLQWCPAPITAENGTYGILAVLCGDGLVRVVEVKTAKDSSNTPLFEYIESPMATLGTADEYNVHVTCLTWIGINRLALGHSDGTVSLWSVYPHLLLQRHAVHSSFILDISSAYPSHPYLVATTPVSGCTTLTDLTQPTSECTYIVSPSVAFQPGLLHWNDHMQGWVALFPSTGPGATSLTFLHARAFCQPRAMATFPSGLTYVSTSAAHPYVLVGCADGSLWSFHALAKLFKLRNEPTYKIKVCEHEFRPPETFASEQQAQEKHGDKGEAPLRGAARLLHGFPAEVNGDPRKERGKGSSGDKPSEGKKGKKAKPGRRKGKSHGDLGLGPEGEDADEPSHLRSRFVLHDPLTRVTAVAWNPNIEFGCWAATAFGSGLVRVMDLGAE